MSFLTIASLILSICLSLLKKKEGKHTTLKQSSFLEQKKENSKRCTGSKAIRRVGLTRPSPHLFLKMAEYWIDFASVLLEASNSDEAYEEARKLVSAGEIEIDQICKK